MNVFRYFFDSRKRSAILLSVIFVLFIFYKTCTPDVPWGLRLPKIGQVIDAETGKPVSGAYVIARWGVSVQGWLVEGSRGGCIHQEIVTTDAEGRYQLPSVTDKVPIDWIHEPQVNLHYWWQTFIYSPGYIDDLDSLRFSHSKNDKQRLDIQLRSGARKYWKPPQLSWYSYFLYKQKIEPLWFIKNTLNTNERINYFDEILTQSICKRNEQESEIPFKKLIFYEAYKTVCDEHKDLTIGTAELLREIWYATIAPSKDKFFRNNAIRALLGEDTYHRQQIPFSQTNEVCSLLKD